jgi:hypothetical protein
MRFRALILLLLMTASCAPVSNTTAEPTSLPPDSAVTSHPGNDLPTTEPHVNLFSPKPGDEKLARGSALLNQTSLLIRESYPPQISLSVSGDLPTPCHELRAEINPPDPESKITVEIYSVVDENMVCIQVLEPFEEYIDLGTFPSGHYSVWVNGELAGEFDS